MPEGDTYVAEIKVIFNPDGSLSGRPVLLESAERPGLARACGKRDARGPEMRPAEGSGRIHALFRTMEGRNHPFRSARDPGMTSAATAAPSCSARGRHPKTRVDRNAYFTKAYRGAHSRRDRGCRLRWLRAPVASPSVPRGGGSQTVCAAAHAPHAASRRCGGSSPDGAAAGRTARAHDVSAAGRLRRLAGQDLSSHAGSRRGSRPTPMSTSRRCASPITRTARCRNRRSSSTRRQTRLSNRRPRASLPRSKNCNPLPVPAQYRPFYEQWKTKTIHFDPQVAAR